MDETRPHGRGEEGATRAAERTAGAVVARGVVCGPVSRCVAVLPPLATSGVTGLKRAQGAPGSQGEMAGDRGSHREIKTFFLGTPLASLLRLSTETRSSRLMNP